MNEREVAELRRRFKPEKSNITHIRGCYVNENREIVSQFDQPLTLLEDEELERFLSVLKRTLTGGLGKNLVDLTFSTKQVAEGEEHKLLMTLRNSALQDSGAVFEFFSRVMESLELEGNYLILLAYDKYDVPYRSKDGERQMDASSEVFSYVLCSICPVKLTKPALSYYVKENEFRSRGADWLVSPPELGFLFPAFDNRSTNLYNALYYSRDPGENYAAFVDRIFKAEAPMPAEEQKETFGSLLGNTLEEDCCYEVVQAVQNELRDIITEHKQSKDPEALVLSKQAVRRVLEDCGVSPAHAEAFTGRYDESFGEDMEISPRNLVGSKVEVRTPDVTIQVNPERSGLVETRVIQGVKYILIRADEGVEVNGVNIQIT